MAAEDEDTGVPRMNPEDINTHIAESLQRLQVDAIDMYWVHTDEPSIPAGEILGMLAEHCAAGRLKAIRLFQLEHPASARGISGGGRCHTPGLCCQPGGFFAAKYDGLDFSAHDFPKPDLPTKYGNELSYSRREIAGALAREKGYSANQVALAPPRCNRWMTP